MFQNSYQNGTYFDLLDAKLPADKLKPLLRTANVNTNYKVFDKDLKTFVLEFATPTAKLVLPREEKKDLYLIQQYLVLQIYILPGLSWNLELVLSDLTKTKRRVILSPSATKTQIKPFFVKTACSGFKEGTWNNLSIDLYSYMSAFKGQTFRSLDAIHITGHFKLRRLYTSACEPLEDQGEAESQEVKQVSFLPKNFYLPAGVPYVTRVNRYDPQAENYHEGQSQNGYEPTEPSTKNSSFLKSSKTKPPSGNKPALSKPETAKTEKTIHIKHRSSREKQKENDLEKQEAASTAIQGQTSKKIKDFLSNTNGDLLGRKKKEQEKSQSDSSQVILQGIPKTAKSTEKYSKKKNLIKTQQMPPKARSSLDKNPIPRGNHQKPQDKSKTRAKLNPWRTTTTTSKGVAVPPDDNSQLQSSKQEQRSIDTPQTVSIFKQHPHPHPLQKYSETKGTAGGFQRECSDSEYVELSQKFSTLTDGKFFRNQVVPRGEVLQTKGGNLQDQGEDEIQENIEMETNSMYSSVKREENTNKYHSPHPNHHSPHPVHESICDSLQPYEQPRKGTDSMGKSSLYGFGERLMRNFMDEVQRPYSPPLGERENTEQELSEYGRGREEKEEVELVYDPVLNCYYDHKTHTYYELKN